MFLFIDEKRERHGFIVPLIYTLIGWFLHVPGDQTHSLGISGLRSNQANYAARAVFHPQLQFAFSTDSCSFQGEPSRRAFVYFPKWFPWYFKRPPDIRVITTLSAVFPKPHLTSSCLFRNYQLVLCNSLRYTPGRGIPESQGNSVFDLLSNHHLFSTVTGTALHSHQQRMGGQVPLAYVLTNTGDSPFFLFVNDSNHSGCECYLTPHPPFPPHPAPHFSPVTKGSLLRTFASFTPTWASPSLETPRSSHFQTRPVILHGHLLDSYKASAGLSSSLSPQHTDRVIWGHFTWQSLSFLIVLVCGD